MLRGGSRNQRKGGPENFVLRENFQDRMQIQFVNILFPFKRGGCDHIYHTLSLLTFLFLWILLLAAPNSKCWWTNDNVCVLYELWKQMEGMIPKSMFVLNYCNQLNPEGGVLYPGLVRGSRWGSQILTLFRRNYFKIFVPCSRLLDQIYDPVHEGLRSETSVK
jgi:hypothetical protein